MAFFLVTGGAGFIGSNLVAALLGQGHRVRVLDNFSTGRRENLEPCLERIELIEGDLRSFQIVQEAVDGIDFVLHQGALPSVPRSIQNPIATNEVNVVGTLHVLQAALKAGVKRLIYASSSSVYGDNADLPKHEAMRPNPISPYAVSKLAGEQYCRSYWRIYGLETVCLRYFNVFGPGQDPESQYAAVIPRFIQATLHNTPITVHGDGKQSRDFTFVENVVRANIRACTAPEAAGQVLNIAGGERHTLLDLIASLAEIVGTYPELTFTERRPGDVLHSQADISRAAEVLGYAPCIGFVDGLRKTVDWLAGQG